MSRGFFSRLLGYGSKDLAGSIVLPKGKVASPVAPHLLDERQVALRCAEAREEERRRMAVDLHDGPIQQLVNLVLRLDMAEKSLSPDAEQHRTELQTLRRYTKEMLQDMRRFMFELRPASLDEFALLPVLRQYLQDYRSQYGIPVELRLADSDWHLGRDAEINLFRIIQEALTNVRKHAKASQIELSLSRTGATVVAQISDNGQGFDVEDALFRARKEKRLGLASMRDRARALSGTLEVESDGPGTRVRVTIPVSGSESAG